MLLHVVLSLLSQLVQVLILSIRPVPEVSVHLIMQGLQLLIDVPVILGESPQ